MVPPVQVDSLTVASSPIVLSSSEFVHLMYGFAGTLIAIWLIFWIAAMRHKTGPLAVIRDPGFLRVVTVGVTLSAVVILSLARVLTGELAGAVLSGIAGYVLGSIRQDPAPGAPTTTPPLAPSAEAPAGQAA